MIELWERQQQNFIIITKKLIHGLYLCGNNGNNVQKRDWKGLKLSLLS